jgi:hypothetical protein
MSRSMPGWLGCVCVTATIGCSSRQGAVTAAAPTVRVQFVAHDDSFNAAANEYERLWAAEGARIVRTMERVSGLRFVSSNYADTAITAQVLERASRSGYRDTPMRLRASYPFDTRRATLIHELGHRLQAGLFRREEEEHGPLFLWIYDVWVDLYGREFADAQVAVERRRGGPYPAAWDAAMALSASERAAKWKALVAERMSTRH